MINLDSSYRIIGKDAGLHLMIESENNTTEEMMISIAEEGVKVYSPEKYFAERGRNRLIMIGYGGLNLEETKDAAERIARALRRLEK